MDIPGPASLSIHEQARMGIPEAVSIGIPKPVCMGVPEPVSTGAPGLVSASIPGPVSVDIPAILWITKEVIKVRSRSLCTWENRYKFRITELIYKSIGPEQST